MIKLTEILHTISDSKQSGMSDLDSWKITDADYMEDMGFTASGQHHYSMGNPKLSVCYKKGVGFMLEDGTRKEQKTFPTFDEMSEYFSKYQQNWENKPYV